MLRRLSPAEELAFHIAFCADNPYCRKDPLWRDRIPELERAQPGSAAGGARSGGAAPIWRRC